MFLWRRSTIIIILRTWLRNGQMSYWPAREMCKVLTICGSILKCILFQFNTSLSYAFLRWVNSTGSLRNKYLVVSSPYVARLWLKFILTLTIYNTFTIVLMHPMSVINPKTVTVDDSNQSRLLPEYNMHDLCLPSLSTRNPGNGVAWDECCLLYTSDAADE